MPRRRDPRRLALLSAYGEQTRQLAAISRPTTRMAAAGFGIAAVSGAGLLATKATEYVGNPFLYIKIPAIGLALLNVFLVHRSRRTFMRPVESGAGARKELSQIVQ